MKKKGIINLLLFLLLVGLLVFTYYYEELRFFENREITNDKIDLAFDVKEIKEIRLKHTTLTYNGKYEVVTPHYLADELMLKNLLNSFSHFKVKRKLSDAEIFEIIKNKQENLFFREDPFFVDLDIVKIDGTIHTEKYIWGNYLGKDLGHYIKRTVDKKTEWLLVEDLSPMNGLYYQDDDVNLVKYENIKALLTGKPENYFAKKVFAGFSLNDLVSIEFRNFRNKPFLLNFSDKKTYPEKFSELNYNETKFSDFLTALQNIEQTEVIFSKLDREKKLKELATLTLNFKNQKIVTAILYVDKETLLLSLNNYTFKLKAKDRELFFLHEQDFWNKFVVPLEELTFEKDKLVDVIKKEAQFVRRSDEEKLSVKSQIGKLKIKENSLTFYDSGVEIIVSHLEKKLNYHFKRN